MVWGLSLTIYLTWFILQSFLIYYFILAHWNAKQYFDWFLRNERLEIRPKIGQILKVELNGNCEAMAKVLQVDSMLAQIHFEKENRFEWIYLGSPRISQIYRELVKTKRLDNIIQFKTYNTSLSANDDVVMFDFVHKPDDEPNKNYIEPPSVPVIGLTRSTKHDCCHSCVRSEDKFSKIEQYPALLRPILLGWKRSLDKRYYVAPCGKSLHSLNDVDKFLFLTDSKLRIDCFDFSKNCDIPSHMKTTVAPNHNIAVRIINFTEASNFIDRKWTLTLVYLTWNWINRNWCLWPNVFGRPIF